MYYYFIYIYFFNILSSIRLHVEYKKKQNMHHFVAWFGSPKKKFMVWILIMNNACYRN